MKNFSLKSFLSVAVLSLAVLILWGISNKTFSAYTGDYLEFTPTGCNAWSMTGLYITWGNAALLTGWITLNNMILIIDSGTYIVSWWINMGVCATIITNGNTPGNVILQFQGGVNIINFSNSSYIIRWFDKNHILEILWNSQIGNGITLTDSSAIITNTIISGFNYWIKFSTIINGTIENNIFTNNNNSIALLSSSGNLLSGNTIQYNSWFNIRLQAWSDNNIISNNNIYNNTGDGIFLETVINNNINNNNITGNTRYGIYLNASYSNTIALNVIKNNNRGIYLLDTNGNITVSSNTITNNGIWVALWNSKSNIFNNNTINSNTNIWIALYTTSNVNTFTNDTITYNKNKNINIDTSDDNQFTNTTIQNSIVGILFNNAKYNTFSGNVSITDNTGGIQLTNLSNNNIFSGVNVTNNITGITLDASSNNTFKLINNTNGIYLSNSSNSNRILNTQIAGQNNIFIYGGTNNIVTWGIFTGTIVGGKINITLKNDQPTLWRTYIPSWVGLSWVYSEISMASTIYTTGVALSAGDGYKDITVTYNNSNIYYDSIYADVTTPILSGGSISVSNNTATFTFTSNEAGSITYSWSCWNGSLSNSSSWNNATTFTLANNTYSWCQLKVTDSATNASERLSLPTFTINYTAPTGGGWWGGWGWGGWIPTCVSTQLMCVNGVYLVKTGVYCQWGNLTKSCGTTTGWISSGTTLPVGSIVWSPYSDELNEAYLRAYAHSITTMNTIQKADMKWTLIRSHMAKMISNFAIKLGGFTPDISKKCEFNDIANQNTEMKFYIKLSCQLGLMGINMSQFDPNTDVTRAQFGTILSRLIWGTTYNWGTPYYTSHLKALKLAGIMTQISTPSTKELRGYVMLMMKRTYEWGFLNN